MLLTQCTYSKDRNENKSKMMNSLRDGGISKHGLGESDFNSLMVVII